MKNKLLKLFLFLIIGISSFARITNVSAVATSGDIITGKTVSGGPFYVVHNKGNGHRMWLTEKFIVRSSDGAFVYCVQPYVTIKQDNTYNVTTEDYASVLNISQDTWSTISKIAYYGYQYKDSTHDHSAEKWYAAAQMLIWNKVNPSIDSYFTNTLDGTRNDNILKAEQNEIMDLVNNHNKKPSFSNMPSEMVIGSSITLTDNNGVLENYEISDVKGATITKNGNNLTITATEVGNMSFKLVKLGNRYGEPVRLYYASDSQNVIRRGNIDPIMINNSIKVYGGKVSIQKTDADTYEFTPQGEATLGGAKYGIYKEDGTRVGEITTNEEGKATSDYLPNLGTFYLLEEKASTGYQLDKNKYYFYITKNDLNPNVQVFEKVIERKFDFTKVYATDKTAIMTPEVGVKFEIYNNKNESVGEYTTDEQGNFEVKLPYGTYTVKQLTVTSGHEKMDDFTIQVKEVGNPIKKTISNAEITAKLRVVKIDSETKQVIKRAGIKFKIIDTKTNKEVCQTTSYPKQTICTFETDENGEFITAYPLNTGTYKLQEVDQVIDGYLWNKESLEFTIDENSKLREDSEYGIIFDTNFENTPVKGEVKINKVGEMAKLTDNGYVFTKESLEGIVFGLYQNDKEITTGVTNKEGILTFSNLKLGSYCIKELKTLDGYILNDKAICFELKYKDQYTPVITYEILVENKLQTSKLEITKKDVSTDETLPNTTIEVYTENDELIYSGKTDNEGKITIDRLPIGKYYFIEKEAPEGYLINEEKMYFEAKGEEIVKSTMKDEKITGKLEFTKVDFSEDNPLPNTLIEIYNAENDELIFSGRTDENGSIIIEKIEYGKYYILEKEAPEGYELNPERMYFEIKENGEVVKSIMKDKKIVKVPNTDATDYKELLFSGISLIVLGAGVIIYGKKKNKK